MRILLVEDEIHLAEAIGQILKKENYMIDMVHDGQSGLDYALSEVHDLIILDIMLPKINGLQILKQLRKEGIMIPVLLLTAKGEVSDKVIGLDSGADDYLAKPFAKDELLARIRALSRRKGEIVKTTDILFGDVSLNHDELLLRKDEKEISLTLKEADLLEFLIHRNGMIASKELIIEKLWGFDSEAEHNNVEVYISFLRKKLTFLHANVTIKTTRGIGYSLEVQSCSND